MAASNGAFTSWTNKNKAATYNGYRFDGEIKNFSECLTKLGATPEKMEADCIKTNATKNEDAKDKSEKASAIAYNQTQIAKCKAVAKGQEQIKKLMKSVEKEFNCQGLCAPSTWWWYGDITTGSPQKGCMIAIKQKFSASAGIAAIVMVISIIVSFCLLVCTCGQVCNKKE